MAIVSSTIIKSYCGISDADYTSYGAYIHNAIEQFVKHYAGPIESTVYTNKLYDGSGNKILRLDVVPIISIKYIALSVDDVIKIKNIMTDSSLASIVVDATNITLTVEGGSGNGTSTLSKATYTTCALLVNAINALSANGWSAEIYDSDYNSLKTAYMMDQQIECAQDEGVIHEWQYLSLAHNFASGIVINKETGEIYYSGGFSKGFKNICITYTAGYATPSSDCPDIYWWVMNTVKQYTDKKIVNAEGITQWRVGDWAITYGSLKENGIDIPFEMFETYKNKLTRI